MPQKIKLQDEKTWKLMIEGPSWIFLEKLGSAQIIGGSWQSPPFRFDLNLGLILMLSYGLRRDLTFCIKIIILAIRVS